MGREGPARRPLGDQIELVADDRTVSGKTGARLLEREQPRPDQDRAAAAELRPAAPDEDRAGTPGGAPGTTAPELDSPSIAPGLRVELPGGVEHDEQSSRGDLMQPLHGLKPGTVRRQ